MPPSKDFRSSLLRIRLTPSRRLDHEGCHLLPRLDERTDEEPESVQDIGWKAQVRLCKRFRRLVARGKHPNVAVTAIARELIAFMWAIAKEVPLNA